MFEIFNVGLVVGTRSLSPTCGGREHCSMTSRKMKNRQMQNGRLKSGCLLFSGGLALLVLGACASTPQQTKPVEPTADARPLGKKAFDAINPFNNDELNQAAIALREKVEQVDVVQFNSATEKLNELLVTLETSVKGVEEESIARVLEKWSDSATKLAVASETLERAISGIETELLNEALQDAARAAGSWRASGEDLQALLAEVRALLAGVDATQITETVQHIRESAESLQLATAKLPSTTTSLSTTIWLLNGLLAIGITLGVLRIVRHRTTKQ